MRGAFSYLLWAERGKTLAAIGRIARVGFFQRNNLTEARAFLAIAGQADTTDPFALQTTVD